MTTPDPAVHSAQCSANGMNRSGDHHYREAERLLSAASYFDSDPIRNPGASSKVREAPLLVAMAQVHATLAVAAATLDAAFVVKPQGGDVWIGDRRYVTDSRNGEGYGR